MFLLQEQPQHLLKHHQLSTAPLHTTSYTIPSTTSTTQLPPHNPLPTPSLLPTYSVPTPFPHLSIRISHFHFHIFHLTPPFHTSLLLPLPTIIPSTTIPYTSSTFTFPFTYTHSIPPPHNSIPTPYLLPFLTSLSTSPTSTIPSTTSTTHCQQTHNLLVKSMRVHQSV